MFNLMDGQLVEDERKRCRSKNAASKSLFFDDTLIFWNYFDSFKKKDGFLALVWTGTRKISKFDLMDEFNHTFTKDEFTKHIDAMELDFNFNFFQITNLVGSGYGHSAATRLLTAKTLSSSWKAVLVSLQRPHRRQVWIPTSMLLCEFQC